MKTDQQPESTITGFLQTVSVAMARLKQQLQCDYEQSYPELREVIHLVIDEEESRAWGLSMFPHLLLPDLVEAHIATINLQPVETKHGDLFAPRHFDEIETHEPVFALCG
jgi:hypothetical protein